MTRLNADDFAPSLDPPDSDDICQHCMEDEFGERCPDLAHCAHCGHALKADAFPVEVDGIEWCGVDCASYGAPIVTDHNRYQHAEAAMWWSKALAVCARRNGLIDAHEQHERLVDETSFHANWARPDGGTV